jgi:hypothetical protein
MGKKYSLAEIAAVVVVGTATSTGLSQITDHTAVHAAAGGAIGLTTVALKMNQEHSSKKE